jgi:hypothetical protein
MATFIVTQKHTDKSDKIKARSYKEAGSKYARKHNLAIGYLNIRKIDNLDSYEAANGYGELDYDIHNKYTY